MFLLRDAVQELLKELGIQILDTRNIRQN